MSKIDRPVSAVTPDGFRLQPTYDDLVAETGFDPALPVESTTPAG